MNMARPRKPTIVLPPYVHRVVSRGKEYFTYQRGKGTKTAGPRIKLPHPSDPDFLSAVYRAAGEPPPKPTAGTFEALVTDYKTSPEWRDLSEATQRDYARYLREVEQQIGRFRVDALEPKHVLAMRDDREDTPAAANNLVRVLSSVISWSVPRGYRNDNPCEHVRKFKIGEWPRWSWEAICHFRVNAVPEMWGSAALALYTGQRQGDVLSMGWSSVDSGCIEVVQEKTGKKVWIPIHRDLKAVLADMPRRSVKILTNQDGVPWTKDGFRSQWAHQMDCIELESGDCHGMVFHGLRKSAVCMLLEAGCSDAMVSAITGQSRAMVEHYSHEINQHKLAAAAILAWENAS